MYSYQPLLPQDSETVVCTLSAVWVNALFNCSPARCGAGERRLSVGSTGAVFVISFF